MGFQFRRNHECVIIFRVRPGFETVVNCLAHVMTGLFFSLKDICLLHISLPLYSRPKMIYQGDPFAIIAALFSFNQTRQSQYRALPNNKKIIISVIMDK